MLPEIAPLNENTPSYYHYKAKDQGVEEKQKFEVQPKINKPLNICVFSPVHRTIFQLICEIYKYHSAKRAVDAALSNSTLLICAASRCHLASLNVISFTVGEAQLMKEFKLLWPTAGISAREQNTMNTKNSPTAFDFSHKFCKVNPICNQQTNFTVLQAEQCSLFPVFNTAMVYSFFLQKNLNYYPSLAETIQ